MTYRLIFGRKSWDLFTRVEVKRKRPVGLTSVCGVSGTGWLEKTYGPSRKGFHASESWTGISCARVRDHPDATLQEHAVFCGVDRSVIGKALQRMKITRKKRPSNTQKRSGKTSSVLAHAAPDPG